MSIKEQLQRQVQFFHPEKKYSFLRGGSSSVAHAALFGLREQFYNAMKEIFSSRVDTAAKTLCDDSDYVQAIKSLPFKTQAKIVVLGDSLTDDSQSWFSIIERSFAIIRPDDNIQFINLAVSGDTTTQLLGSVIPATQLKADLYFCFSGTNDARIQGGNRYKPCTSIEEVERNIASVIDFGQQQTNAPWVWITPVGVDPTRIAAHDFFKPLMANWCNEHITKVAALINHQAENVIDLRPHFTNLDDSHLLDDDGLHWSIEGQQLAAKIIIKQLVKVIR
ncbi:MAG: SGNH/GDSL hydrolase family protein [Alteromonadaceae bacterium]|nr:SGNH/GDSL hydrolase family protein [Alteromonadaceae bacterium]